jgi:hypothetical protein
MSLAAKKPENGVFKKGFFGVGAALLKRSAQHGVCKAVPKGSSRLPTIRGRCGGLPRWKGKRKSGALKRGEGFPRFQIQARAAEILFHPITGFPGLFDTLPAIVVGTPANSTLSFRYTFRSGHIIPPSFSNISFSFYSNISMSRE